MMLVTLKHSFKTRTGPAGRPGTRPTRAWDRSGWRQKPARELTRRNPVDPEGRPGTRSTRSNPGETRSIFFLILTALKQRRYKSLSQLTNNHVSLFLFNFPHYLFIRPYHLFPLSLFLDFLFNFMSHYHRFFRDIF